MKYGDIVVYKNQIGTVVKSENDFKLRFGKDIKDVFGSEFDKFIKLGLMQYIDGRYSLTLDGINVSNSILCEFV